ncbi:TIGR03943 family putative permease subunit [Vallitalea guaymasensis]|uniref:TIGR03943 family putative permease subunit n=1 Tax=Vallitalea guaymasensis TaxID=1185412 RepID=UPI0038CD9F60
MEVIGLVFKDNKEFKDNEFVPARLLMVCCATDMVPICFYVIYQFFIIIMKIQAYFLQIHQHHPHKL